MSESDQVERLLRSLRRLESDLVERSAQASQRSRGVATLVRALAIVMGALALANLYFVNDLTQEVRAAIANMDEMTDYFGENCYWLFYRKEDWKIRYAFKICKEKRISSFRYLMGILKKI